MQKCRCWKFTISNTVPNMPMCLAVGCVYLCWDYDEEMRFCRGFVQYPTARAAGRVPESSWTKSDVAFRNSPECYMEYTYGNNNFVAPQPEVMTEEVYKLVAARDKWISEQEQITAKLAYRTKAERKRKYASQAELDKTASYLKRMKAINRLAEIAAKYTPIAPVLSSAAVDSFNGEESTQV